MLELISIITIFIGLNTPLENYIYVLTLSFISLEVALRYRSSLFMLLLTALIVSLNSVDLKWSVAFVGFNYLLYIYIMRFVSYSIKNIMIFSFLQWVMIYFANIYFGFNQPLIYQISYFLFSLCVNAFYMLCIKKTNIYMKQNKFEV